MTKQEEIREGMAKKLSWILTGEEWSAICEESQSTFLADTDELLYYLHSKGVVIKVDRKPKNPFDHSWMPIEREAYNRALQDLVAVEPLIEEG